MREILFKAKRKDNGEWVEGYYLKYIKPSNGEIEHRIFVSDGDGVTWYTVTEDTLCQYTGLTDKNGKKIWENDVVKKQYLVFISLRKKEVRTKIGYVDFSCDGYGNGYWAYWWDEKNGRCNFGINSADCEVIGNIFDHPELMKGEEHETD